MGPIDGTVAPSAAGGEESARVLPQPLAGLKNMQACTEPIAEPLGFVNAFNSLKKWYDTIVDRSRDRGHHAADGQKSSNWSGVEHLRNSGGPARAGCARDSRIIRDIDRDRQASALDAGDAEILVRAHATLMTS